MPAGMPPGANPFVVLVLLAIALAIAERWYSLANESRMLREGGVEIAPRVFRLMVPVYVLVFPAALTEHLLAPRVTSHMMIGTMGGLFLVSKGLKLWVILHLREGWTMKVILPQHLHVVTTGPYRFMRHPNYIAVMGEILALPLAGGAWVTATAAGILFMLILVARVRTEEEALMARPEYVAALGGKRRFLPGRRG